MKHVISIFLAIVIAIGVAVPLMVQLQGEDVSEMKEKGEDGDDDYKIGKEKDICTFSIQLLTKFDVFSTENSREKQYYKHDSAVSENHAFLPEMPPEV